MSEWWAEGEQQQQKWRKRRGRGRGGAGQIWSFSDRGASFSLLTSWLLISDRQTAAAGRGLSFELWAVGAQRHCAIGAPPRNDQPPNPTQLIDFRLSDNYVVPSTSASACASQESTFAPLSINRLVPAPEGRLMPGRTLTMCVQHL